VGERCSPLPWGKIVQHFFVAIAAVLVVVLLQAPADAFWGFGSSRGTDASGLDLVEGYDRNTVATLTGRVAASPDPASDPVTMELVVGAEKVTLVLGPRWYLQDDDLDWKVGSSVTVRGSKAQGRDGQTYLLTQWISTPSGGSLMLRSDTGRASWAGGRQSGQQGAQGAGGATQRGGSGGAGGMRKAR